VHVSFRDLRGGLSRTCCVRAPALLTTLAAPAACAAVAAGCGAAGHTSTAAPSPAPSPTRSAPVAQARCLGGPAAPKVTPYTLGVFRAGPLTLVLYRDLAQVSLAQAQAGGKGVGATVTVSGRRPVILRVDAGSRRRLGLQFTDMSGYGPGLSAVRFPACPGRQAIGGGLAVHARGCAGLHVSTPATPPLPVLIPIGNSLAGCPRSGRAARLPSASFPYLGIACHIANWARCNRIRIGVHLSRPAILVTVQVDGHLVTLSPPPDPGDDLWQGALFGMGPRHGPLAVHARHGYWYGEPPVHPRVRVTAYFADGTAATRAGIGYLHAGYG
jgi:hypothetical protein